MAASVPLLAWRASCSVKPQIGAVLKPFLRRSRALAGLRHHLAQTATAFEGAGAIPWQSAHSAIGRIEFLGGHHLLLLVSTIGGFTTDGGGKHGGGHDLAQEREDAIHERA